MAVGPTLVAIYLADMQLNLKTSIFSGIHRLLLGGGLGLMLGLCQMGHMGCTDDVMSLVRLGIFAAIGVLASAVAWVVGHQTDKLREVDYVLWLGLRYAMVYKLAFYALNYTEGQYFETSLVMQDYTVADLNSGQVVWLFMGHTSTLTLLLGLGLLASAILLLSRHSAVFGAMLGVMIWGGLATMALAFGLCTKSASLGMLACSGLIMLGDAGRLLRVAIGRAVSQAKSYPLIDSSTHLYRSMTLMKLTLVIGALAFFANKIWNSHHYYKSNEDSPIVGVWDIIDLKYQSDTGQLSRDTIPVELAKFKSLFLDESRFGAVKINDDSLSTFEYIVDSNFNQLEFWNFFDFKELDLKGKYEFLAEDTIVYKGTNRKEKIEILLKRNPRYKKTSHGLRR